MPKPTAYATVESFLKKSGYRLLRQRRYPGVKNARFVVFANPSRPLIGFPVVEEKVLDRHWERIRFVVELHNEED